MASLPIEDIEKMVGSRYALTVLAGMRARELRDGSPRLVNTDSNNPILIALQEIQEGKIYVETPAEAPAPPEVATMPEVELSAEAAAAALGAVATVDGAAEDVEPELTSAVAPDDEPAVSVLPEEVAEAEEAAVPDAAPETAAVTEGEEADTEAAPEDAVPAGE